MTTTLRVAAALLAAAGLAAADTGTMKGTVEGPDGPLPGAVVMVDGPAAPAPAGAPHATIDQRNETFVPRVLGIPVGTTVDFPNSDPVLHNVSSASPAKPFDLGMYGQGETRSVTFDRPGVVAIRCNVHPRMAAFVVVHTSPLVAVTGERGGWTIGGIPPGTHPVRVWHETLGERRTSAAVRAGEVTPVSVRFERRR